MTVCPLCSGRGFRVLDDGIAEECPCIAEILAEKQRIQNLVDAGFPLDSRDISEYQGERSRAVVNKLMTYTANWETEYRHDSLYVVGAPSTQKTTVWRWIGAELLGRGFRVKYVLFANLLRAVMQLTALDFRAKEESEAYLTRLYDSDLIIFDEAFDPTKAVVWKSGHHAALIDGIFRELLELHHCACVFISNYPLSNIGEAFNATLQELISRNIVAVLKFEDQLDFNQEIKKEHSLWTAKP